MGDRKAQERTHGSFPARRPAGHHFRRQSRRHRWLRVRRVRPPEPAKLADLFQRMGYAPVARHKTKNITVYRQGDINYLLNAEPGSFAVALRCRARPLRTIDGLARRARPPRVRPRRQTRRRALHRRRQDPRGAGHQRYRRLAHLFRRQVRRAGFALRARVRVARRARSEDRKASASITSITSPTTSIAATWTSGSTSMRSFSTSARSASSTSRASLRVCTRVR